MGYTWSWDDMKGIYSKSRSDDRQTDKQTDKQTDRFSTRRKKLKTKENSHFFRFLQLQVLCVESKATFKRVFQPWQRLIRCLYMDHIYNSDFALLPISLFYYNIFYQNVWWPTAFLTQCITYNIPVMRFTYSLCIIFSALKQQNYSKCINIKLARVSLCSLHKPCSFSLGNGWLHLLNKLYGSHL